MLKIEDFSSFRQVFIVSFGHLIPFSFLLLLIWSYGHPVTYLILGGDLNFIFASQFPLSQPFLQALLRRG